MKRPLSYTKGCHGIICNIHKLVLFWYDIQSMENKQGNEKARKI